MKSANKWTDPNKLNKANDSKNETKTSTISNNYSLKPYNIDVLLANSQGSSAFPHQSSTETSGIGETITSGCSSPESLSLHPGYLNNAVHKESSKENISQKSNPRHFNIDVILDDRSRATNKEITVPGRKMAQIKPELNVKEIVFSNNVAMDSKTYKALTTQQSNCDSIDRARKQSLKDSQRAIEDSSIISITTKSTPLCENIPALQQCAPSHNKEFDALFEKRNLKSISPINTADSSAPSMLLASGFKSCPSDHDRKRRGSILSIRSISSKGSSKSRRGSFLGRRTESAWLRWSRDRRASFQRRCEKLEEEEKERRRIPTPIKKARQECLSFVHPDLEHKYLSEEEIHAARQRQLHEQIYYGSNGNGDRKSGTILRSDLLSERDWHIISEFWDHKTFNSSRILGYSISFIAIILCIIGVTTPTWATYTTKLGVNIDENLWRNCSFNYTLKQQLCLSFISSTHWQNAVIGFLMFSTVFGFIGTVLAGFGLFTTALPKKIYYYHSSGEIFSICAVSIVIAVIIYPIAIALDETIQTYHLSLGYGLAWSSAFFFLASALCMSLDDIIRGVTNSKLCKTCFKKEEEDNRQRV